MAEANEDSLRLLVEGEGNFYSSCKFVSLLKCP